MRTIFCEPEIQPVETIQQSLDDVIQQEEKNDIEYIGGMFPRGKLSAFIGDISAGKSTVLAAVSLTITDGDVFLNDSVSKNNGKVLLINTDGSSDTFIKKISDFGGTSDNIILPKRDAFEVSMSSIGSHPISYFSKNYKDSIVDCIKEFEPDLVLIDSLSGFIDVNENSSDIIQPLIWLAELAIHYDVAVVFTHVTNGREKEQERVTLNCVRGFAGILQIPVSVWAVESLADGKERKLYQIKNNLGLLDNQEYIIVFGDSGVTFVDKMPIENLTKAERRKNLFDANEDKSTTELIQLLQKKEPDTSHEAAKQAVARWRKTIKK